MLTSLVVHYKELALKGKNRPWFIQLLVRNLKTALSGLHVRAVRSIMGRIEIDLGAAADREEAPGAWRASSASRIFRSRARAALEFDALARSHPGGRRRAHGRRRSAWRPGAPTSGCRSRRRSSSTRWADASRQATGWHVDLERPALTIHIEMLADSAFYFFGKEPGAGGLPTGTSGRVACLLSGGIDSPVAAYRMMRRGCVVLLIHFHSYPILSRASQEKVREIAALLTRHQLHSRLHLVAFGELQQQVLLSVAPELRVVVYRRLMLRIAERIARHAKARALVTGEVLGQVASQTLENMTLIARATRLQVLRPLVGMDKDEITAQAERIGTYPISIIPDQDCCTLFTPQAPGDPRDQRTDRRSRTDAADRRDGRARRAGGRRGGVPIPGARIRGCARRERLEVAMYQSTKELFDAIKPGASVLSDRVSVTSVDSISPEVLDRIAWTAAFGADADLRGAARWVIRSLAAAAGIRPASIHDLYMAMGRGEAGGFTVPAINVRAMAYDTARAVFRSAKKLKAGAFIFEIARSEIGYTEQRPHEYAAVVLAAALREGFRGPLFIQGDHVQTNAKKFSSPERDKELEALRALIKEEIAAGFYNIDIDTSTLVDLSKPTLAEQQEVNVRLAADFAEFIRKNQPHGVTVSVGGEIGEVGGKNSDVHELHAYMDGFNAQLKQRGNLDRPQQDQRPDRDGARRLRQCRRNGAHRRQDRPEDARGAVASRAAGLSPRRSSAARRIDAAARRVRCVPARRRLRNPSRDRFSEHGLRAPAVSGRSEIGDVRLDPRARDRGAEAQGHRRAVHLQGPEEGARPVQAAHVEHSGARHGRRLASRSRSASRSSCGS